MQHPVRCWMTSCLAVVSLALGGQRVAWADEPGAEGAAALRGAWQVSGFGVAETVSRLQASARRHGLGLFACWADGAGAAAALACRPAPRSRWVREDTVLVFESLAGGTPVSMQGDGSRPDLPLSLHVRSRADGGAEVLMPAPLAHYGEHLPPGVARELNELPLLVADALGP